MKKVHIISDTNYKSLKIKNFLTNKIQFSSLKKSSIIVVVGGDGFMLQTLKKNYRLNKPFYGINSGNYGFLMNRFNKEKTYKKIFQAKKIKIYPLTMNVKTKAGNTKKGIAINEVSILRQSRQAASLKINQGKKQIIKELISDGVLVSTPAGSTANNLQHGPVLFKLKKTSVTYKCV